jgi:hypothetical protein
MKFFALATAMLIATAAQALPSTFKYPSASDSWEIIRGNESVQGITQGPLAEAFGPNGYFNACIDGDNFRTVQPQEVCTLFQGSLNGEGFPQVCAKTENRDNSVPRTQTEQRCLKREWVTENGGEGTANRYERCVETASMSYKLPTKMNFVVHAYYWIDGFTGGGEAQGSNNLGSKVLFNKEFQVPNCK